MATKHAKLKSALTRAIVDFFMREDLYADELRIQGTVCITADKSSIFVTQIAETITEPDLIDIAAETSPQVGGGGGGGGRRHLGQQAPHHHESRQPRGASTPNTLLDAVHFRAQSQAAAKSFPYHVGTEDLHGLDLREPNTHGNLSHKSLLNLPKSSSMAADVVPTASIKSTSNFPNLAQTFGSVDQGHAKRKLSNDNPGPSDSIIRTTTSGLEGLERLAEFATSLPIIERPMVSSHDRSLNLSQSLSTGASVTAGNRSSLSNTGEHRRTSSGSSSSSTFSVPSSHDEPYHKKVRREGESLGHIFPQRPMASVSSNIPDKQSAADQADSDCVLVVEDTNVDGPNKTVTNQTASSSVNKRQQQQDDCELSRHETPSQGQHSPNFQFPQDSDFQSATRNTLSVLGAHSHVGSSMYSSGELSHANLQQENSLSSMRQNVLQEMALAASWQAMGGFREDSFGGLQDNAANSDWVKRARTKFSPEQLQYLEEQYQQDPFLSMSSEKRAQLARKLNITERNVQIWFQNQRRRRRAREFCAFTYKPENSTSSFTAGAHDGNMPANMGGFLGDLKPLLSPSVARTLLSNSEPDVNEHSSLSDFEKERCDGRNDEPERAYAEDNRLQLKDAELELGGKMPKCEPRDGADCSYEGKIPD